ncbi:MAG: rod shape-determining protein MreD [bacterium]|nr:rod shape-determining protein MreD [bacterium]
MRHFLLFLLIFFLAVLQITALKYFAISGIVPNVLLILALVFIFFSSFEKYWFYLILIGVILDLFSNFYFGTNLMALLIAAVFFNIFFKKNLNQKNILSNIISGFFIIVFYNLAIWGIGESLAVISASAAPFGSLVLAWPVFLIAIIYNFLIFVLILSFLRQFSFVS